MTDVDYYAVLHAAPSASKDEIQRNYKRLAKAFHPDTGIEDHGISAEINNAWAVLRDPVSRANYDAERAAAEQDAPQEDFDDDFDESWGEESGWEADPPPTPPPPPPPPPPRQGPPPRQEPPPVFEPQPGFQAGPEFFAPRGDYAEFRQNPHQWRAPHPTFSPPAQPMTSPNRPVKLHYLLGLSRPAVILGVLWLVVSFVPAAVSLVTRPTDLSSLVITVALVALSARWARGRIVPWASGVIYVIWVGLSLVLTGVAYMVAESSDSFIDRYFLLAYVAAWTLLYVVASETRRRDLDKAGW